MPRYKDLSARLEKYRIRPSIQRIKVLEYLQNNRCHPTADQVFKALKQDVPTLSKTTVYNTMKVFADAGLIKELNIEDAEIRYDIITSTHGHFKCQECAAISNFALDFDSLAAEPLAGFKILEKNVYFKGLCPECLLNINTL